MKHKNTGSPRTVTGFLVVLQSGHCLVRYLVLPHGYLALYFCFSCFSSIKARFLFTFKFCSPVSAFRSYTHTPYGLSTPLSKRMAQPRRATPKGQIQLHLKDKGHSHSNSLSRTPVVTLWTEKTDGLREE